MDGIRDGISAYHKMASSTLKKEIIINSKTITDTTGGSGNFDPKVNVSDAVLLPGECADYICIPFITSDKWRYKVMTTTSTPTVVSNTSLTIEVNFINK